MIEIKARRHYNSMGAFLARPPLAMTMNSQQMSTICGHLAILHDPTKANQALA